MARLYERGKYSMGWEKDRGSRSWVRFDVLEGGLYVDAMNLEGDLALNKRQTESLINFLQQNLENLK